MMYMDDAKAQKGHSEDYFGSYRDHWWNRDYLNLVAERLQLHHCHSMLDVGCGLCHWSLLLTPYLAAPRAVTGVDNDIKWTQQNPRLEQAFYELGADFSLKAADAHNLPFPDASFDLVTCQTLLIHVINPQMVLQEMKRVLRPGGTILCVEPNNMIQNLVKSSFSEDDSIEEVLDHVKYGLIIERGKKKLGEGDNSLGDLLPGLLAEAGFTDIEVRLSDKAIPMYPPYDKPEQQDTLQQWGRHQSRQAKEKDDLHYFKAFGDRYMDFYERYHHKYIHTGREFIEFLEEQAYHSAGGAMMYLASGIR